MSLLSKTTKGINYILDLSSYVTYRVVMAKTAMNLLPPLQMIWGMCNTVIDTKIKTSNNDFVKIFGNIKHCMQNGWNWEFTSTDHKNWIEVGFDSGIPGIIESKLTGTHLYFGYLLAQFNTGAGEVLNDNVLKYVGTIALLDFATWYFDDSAPEIKQELSLELHGE